MDSYPSNLRVWDGSSSALVQDAALDAYPACVAGPHFPSDFADYLYAKEAFQLPTAVRAVDDESQPYTLQWFLSIENQRFSRRGRWIPHLLEFAKHSGETLLGLGTGLGTDWLQYARHGVAVTVCSPSASQLALVRRNFELRGLAGRFFHAPPVSLPVETASIDVACVTSLMQEAADPSAVVEEIYRVLKPGGKVLLVTNAKYDVDFWYRTVFFWTRWLSPRNHSTQMPGKPHGFSARSLRRLFGSFVEHRMHKRQLRRSEVPPIWRWAPLSVLERIMGRLLILKAFKPLSSVLPAIAAAA